ncbi:MAG: hypothetical protein AAF492_18610, partial [Verrucomicrobiota bacterium]
MNDAFQSDLNPVAEMCTLIDCLNEAEIDYALCGGLAVVVYGYVRATRDIDMLFHPDDLERIKDTVRQVGFTVADVPIEFNRGKPHRT